MKSMSLYAAAGLLLIITASLVYAQQNRDEPGVLSFRLHTDGLSPSQITVPDGRYIIRVVNSAVMKDMTVQLDDDRGSRIGNANSRKGGSKSSFIVRLTPGKHTLSVPGRSTWKSEITVVNKR